MKAIGFQYIEDKAERQRLIKDTRHNLFEILSVVKEKSTVKRPEEEIEWMEKYFADLTKTDRESDSFRYPFHIVWEKDEWGLGGKFVVKPVFNEQIDIDLVKFANKFEAAYEIIQKWYKKETDSAAEWKDVKPIFIETGGYYYSQSVVGYKYSREVFYPYTEAYLETANYLKWYMKMQTDKENADFKKQLFLPMCYLYRNCVELSLKAIWFEETGEDFQKKCKIMLDNKHSIGGMWKNIKPYVLKYNSDGEKYIEVIEDYCMQLHTIDSDANKFRYPMSNSIETGFFTVKVGEKEATQYYSASKTGGVIHSKERYDSKYQHLTSTGYELMSYEPGSVFKLNGKEYVLSENHTLDIPYGEDLWCLGEPENYRFGEKIY